MFNGNSARRRSLTFVAAGVAALTLGAAAQAQLPKDAVERLKEHWNDSKRFGYYLGDALEKLKDGKPESFWRDYAWAKVAIDTGEALLQGGPKGAGKALIEGASGISVGKLYPTIGNCLGWWSAAKQALKILDEKVVTPSRMQTAINAYIKN